MSAAPSDSVLSNETHDERDSGGPQPPPQPAVNDPSTQENVPMEENQTNHVPLSLEVAGDGQSAIGTQPPPQSIGAGATTGVVFPQYFPPLPALVSRPYQE